MPLETGGRADKHGNSYEIDCIIYEMLKVLDEKNYSVCIEPLGIDEIGTDILVTNFDGQKEHQQCKARNASKEYWNISDLKEKNIFSTWKVHLDRDCFRKVALVSPIACTFLSDLHDRASNTSGKTEDFYSIQIMKSSKPFQEFYEKFCFEMDLNSDEDDYILKRSQESFWEKKHRLMVLRALKECANSSAVFFTICERMRKEYKRVLGVDSEILFNRCSSLYDKKLSLCSDENDKIIFLYAGSLYYGREKALIELAKALKKINIENGEKGKEAVLHIYLNALPSDSFLHEIQELGTAKYLGKLDFKELKIKLNECNYPVFVESFEEKQMEKVQLSFSTKIPEYLSLEKTILAIGPDHIGSMDCLRNVAVCINSIEEIYAKVEHLLHYPEEFSNLGLKARQEYEKIMAIPGLEEYIVCE